MDFSCSGNNKSRHLSLAEMAHRIKAQIPGGYLESTIFSKKRGTRDDETLLTIVGTINDVDITYDGPALILKDLKVWSRIKENTYPQKDGSYDVHLLLNSDDADDVILTAKRLVMARLQLDYDSFSVFSPLLSSYTYNQSKRGISARMPLGFFFDL